MTSSARTGVLVGVFVIIALLVVAKYTGGDSGAGPDPGGWTVRDEHRQLTAQTALEQRLLADRDRWIAARVESDRRLDELQAMMITASTDEIAAAALRDTIVGVVEGLGARGVRVEPSQAPPSDEAEDDLSGLRLLVVQVAFDVADDDAAYAIIDKLERLPNVRTGVRSVTVRGPGRMQITGAAVSVDLTLEAVALIAKGSAT